MHSDSGCFQPARGVIHPSFPLRGRWGRPASVGEQAPSPSLAFFCKTSLGMHPWPPLANYAPVFTTANARTSLLESAASEPFPVETDVPQFQKGPPQLKTIPPREKPFSARRHPVLTTEEYSYRCNRLPIPAHDSTNQYLWPEDISEVPANGCQPVPGGLVLLRAHSAEPKVSRSLRPPGSIAPRLFTEKQSNSTPPTLAFLDDSGCRKASAEHMMGLPQQVFRGAGVGQNQATEELFS